MSQLLELAAAVEALTAAVREMAAGSQPPVGARAATRRVRLPAAPAFGRMPARPERTVDVPCVFLHRHTGAHRDINGQTWTDPAAEPTRETEQPPHWTDPLDGIVVGHLLDTALPTAAGHMLECPACRARADIPYPYECPGHPDGQLTPDEVTALLHAHQTHPGWEYATTQGPRKNWDTPDVPPYGPDGEPDPTWEQNRPAGSRNGWQRFDYHEEAYWRRPIADTTVTDSLTPVTD